MVDNFRKNPLNYASSNSVHFLTKYDPRDRRDKNVLMYSLGNPSNLTVITGNHPHEKIVDALTEFFEGFSWKPEKKSEWLH